MAKQLLFDHADYRELTSEELALLQQGYLKAIDALRKNLTAKGFTACSLNDNQVYGTDVNYRAVWARDGCKSIIWTLDLDDADIRECQSATLRTLLSHQAPSGQIPSNVTIDNEQPEYAGVGGITSIDSGLWLLLAVWQYAEATGDWSIAEEFRHQLQRTMDWLSATIPTIVACWRFLRRAIGQTSSHAVITCSMTKSYGNAAWVVTPISYGILAIATERRITSAGRSTCDGLSSAVSGPRPIQIKTMACPASATCSLP